MDDTPHTPDPSEAENAAADDPHADAALVQSARRHWDYFVAPALGDRRFGRAVEITIGQGVYTPFLADRSLAVIGLDMDADAARSCADRFAADHRIRVAATDGPNLRPVDSDSADLVFSFDALVRQNATVLRAFMPEIARVLRPGGLALMHHSNVSHREPPTPASNTHGRTMLGADLFAAFAEAEGLAVESQRIIGWDQSRADHANDPNFAPGSDCITVLAKPR